MKKHRTIGTLLLSALFAFVPMVTFAEASITAFSSHIELQKDGSAQVQEEIVFDFGNTPLHGIYREIPLIMPAVDLFGETRAELSSISVTDGRGVPRQATYDKGGNMITLKIGDYDKLVSGSQLYVIRYTVWGAFAPTFLKDRFTWNITGHEWKVPINRVRADVVLPAPVDPALLTFSCTAGNRESREPCSASGVQNFATSGNATMVRFEQGPLARFQGLMVTVEIPRGVVVYPSSKAMERSSESQHPATLIKWWQRPFLDISLAFPFFVFAGLYSFYLTQRDKKQKKNPPQLLRETYLLAGILLSGFSLFVPIWNLGFFLSGVVIFCFAFAYRR